MGRIREQEKIRELVSAYLDGELSPDDAQYVGRRIQQDPEFSQVYAAYRGIRMDLRAMPRPEAPSTLSQAVHARAAMMQPGRSALNLRQRIARLTAAAATLAATLAAVFTGGFGLQHHFAHVSPGVGPSNQYVSVSQSGPTTATVLNPSIRYDEPAQIRFTRPMNEQTVLTSVAFSPAVKVTNLQYDNTTYTLSTRPRTLSPDTQYSVLIPSGLKDAEGNDVSPGAFSFYVRGAPGITTAPTAPNATAAIDTPTPIAVAVAPTRTPVSVTAPTATEVTETPEATPVTVAVTEPTVAPRPTVAPAPKPTNTPAPAAKPVGTVVAVSESTATAAPTATVAPTATQAPTVAPTATTPAIPVADKFKGAYASLANRLGAPTGAATTVGTSQLFFQNGFMLYAAGQPIYVFYSGDRTYATYGNPGNSGAGSDGGPGPGGLYKPARAFGVLWTAQGLQGKIGYATAPNEVPGTGTLQSFEGGTILSVGGDVYVLLKNGTWQNFSG